MLSDGHKGKMLHSITKNVHANTEEGYITMSVRCSLGHENPDGSAFCDECGEPLNTAAPDATAAPAQAPVATAAPADAGTPICPSCGASNPAGEAFCSNCGNSLLGAPANQSTPIQAQQQPAWEMPNAASENAWGTPAA